MKKHTILFVAANPSGTDRLGLDLEARAIQRELESAGYRDHFELETRWAAEPLDLLRELRRLKPTVVHFSGHGGRRAAGERLLEQSGCRDVILELDGDDGEPRHGLFFQGPDGRPLLVSTAALRETFGAAGASVKLVVLNACYSEVQAEALLAHVDCVVGMGGSILDDAARSFAIGFYGGLGERESVAAAYRQGRAAIRLEGLRDADRPRLKVRPGVDADGLVLAADPREPRRHRRSERGRSMARRTLRSGREANAPTVKRAPEVRARRSGTMSSSAATPSWPASVRRLAEAPRRGHRSSRCRGWPAQEKRTSRASSTHDIQSGSAAIST